MSLSFPCKTSDLFVDLFQSGSIVVEYVWPSLILHHWNDWLENSTAERKCDSILLLLLKLMKYGFPNVSDFLPKFKHRESISAPLRAC